MTRQWRAQFDARVSFVNGGGLSVEEFRLDVQDNDMSSQDVGDMFVRHLGLLMVGSVEVTNLRMLEEQHKGSRGVPVRGTDARKVIELSHVIRDGLITYPGLPAPEISDHLSWTQSAGKYAPGTEFQIGRISMVANTGTYLDTPAHRHRDGTDLAGTPLERMVDLDGIVVRTGERAVTRDLLLPFELKDKAVLLHTGGDRDFGTPAYAENHPYLTGAAAELLAESGAALVGIDSVNIDDTADGVRPAHTALLAAGIPIVEHLRGLDQLPPHGFRFHAAPPAIEGMATFTVRAYAIVEDHPAVSGR